MNKKDVGKKLKEFRQTAGMTQEQLAEKVGIHEKQISRIESGVHFPTFDNFVKIITALNIDFGDLRFEENKNPAKEKLIKIIQTSKDEEAELFLKIIEDIRKYKY